LGENVPPNRSLLKSEMGDFFMGERSKFSTTIAGLKESDPETYFRITSHFAGIEGLEQMTLGELAHYHEADTDPRSIASNRAWGDFTAIGGSGPKK
jgi:hypothetical protein